MIWKTRRHTLSLSRSGVLMGILNATPDSFSDGGEYDVVENGVNHALEMVSQGAGIIDIGGESTRPGALSVGVEEEIARVVPLIESLRKCSGVLISIDTSKPEVAEAALEVGADIVNDVTGMTGKATGDAMIEVCARWRAGVVVMHMQGTPRTMQECPDYDVQGGVVAEVEAFFRERLKTLSARGIDPDCLCFDPGIGFGKTLEHNLELLRNLRSIQEGISPMRPLLLGVSRKSMIGAVTGVENPGDRDAATAVLTAMAFQQHGVMLHRVHNVAVNRQALQLAEATM
jgi:dihydropteroate synthase